jgi:hypothetical protein
VPVATSLRRIQEGATEFLRTNGKFIGVKQPDVEGHVAAAQHRLMQRVNEA